MEGGPGPSPFGTLGSRHERENSRCDSLVQSRRECGYVCVRRSRQEGWGRHTRTVNHGVRVSRQISRRWWRDEVKETLVNRIRGEGGPSVGTDVRRVRPGLVTVARKTPTPNESRLRPWSSSDVPVLPGSTPYGPTVDDPIPEQEWDRGGSDGGRPDTVPRDRVRAQWVGPEWVLGPSSPGRRYIPTLRTGVCRSLVR